jgi:hypothetical protein
MVDVSLPKNFNPEVGLSPTDLEFSGKPKITDIHSVCTILANFIETAPFSGCFILSVTTTQRIKGRPYMSGLPF